MLHFCALRTAAEYFGPNEYFIPRLGSASLKCLFTTGSLGVRKLPASVTCHAVLRDRTEAHVQILQDETVSCSQTVSCSLPPIPADRHGYVVRAPGLRGFFLLVLVPWVVLSRETLTEFDVIAPLDSLALLALPVIPSVTLERHGDVMCAVLSFDVATMEGELKISIAPEHTKNILISIRRRQRVYCEALTCYNLKPCSIHESLNYCEHPRCANRALRLNECLRFPAGKIDIKKEHI